MGETQLLERITLDRQAISFNRMYTTSAVYYHWHQCVELLYISSGYGIVVVDNQHYTARPGRLFVFPPFRLHKVQVDHSDKNPYHRTTMHIAQSVVESALSTFRAIRPGSPRWPPAISRHKFTISARTRRLLREYLNSFSAWRTTRRPRPARWHFW